MSVIWWTDEENELLKQLYPKTIDKNDIIKALKNKSWYAIKKQADLLGIKRDVRNPGGRPKKKPRIHLGHKELAEILKKNLTIDEIAKKLRTTPDTVRRYIQKYGL
jgi:hypothetical protein